MEINGSRVGSDELVPGWTVYGERLPYRAYDVTELLTRGAFAMGAWLGDGWYRGHIGFDGGSRDNFGTDIGVMAQLEVDLADGTRQVVATDGTWTAGFGPILLTGLYEGETYDAREMPRGWDRTGFAGEGFTAVRSCRRDPATLVAPLAEPVRCTQEIQPVSVEPRGEGRYLLDFGQNASGRLRLHINSPRGTTVTVRHAEVLEGGELGVRPLRGAAATDTYISSGEGPVEWEPRFTIHGFRYAEITGWSGPLGPDDAVFRVLHTDAERTGWFECSHPGVTKLHQNVVWSTRSNFVSIPMDCPQRDERLGWTGDLQVFCPTATFLYDLAPLVTDWLRDVWVEQRRTGGGVPVFVPRIPGHFWDDKDSIAVWGDVTVLAPWTLYEQTGDTGVLRDQLASAEAWVDHIQALAGESMVWDRGIQLGDWLDPGAPPDDPFQAAADAHLIATAYMAHSTQVLSWMLRVLGKTSEAELRAAQAAQIRTAFRARFVGDGGRMTSDAQAAYALAIAFDLLTQEQTDGAGRRLAELVRANGGNIATGFAGTPVVCHALEVTGHVEEAYLLLEQDTCPSWLYPVSMGATTTWERWDSMLPDGTINPGDMTSFNHYALGAVADWLHRSVAGLAPATPGYATLRIAPHPGGSLTWARATHRTPYGLASVEWHLRGTELVVQGVIPVGATAILELPGMPHEELRHGRFRRSVPLTASWRRDTPETVGRGAHHDHEEDR
jgi:Alpha-L-rhamnosidase N-terminal domain./Bacterial alpha-L-rhamnosidase.